MPDFDETVPRLPGRLWPPKPLVFFGLSAPSVTLDPGGSASVGVGMRFPRTVMLALILGALLLPRPAAACQTCQTAADCPRGFGCIGNCQATGCTTDAECAPGMRCVSGVNACVPVWQAGCNVDADCGQGFTCVPGGSECGKSGCTTLATCDTNSEVPCQSDADCLPSWTCTTDPGSDCINPGGPANGPDAGVSTQPLTCRPPYWGLSPTYIGPGPASGPAPGKTSGCALGASGGGSWTVLAALLGAGAWGARRRSARRARR